LTVGENIKRFREEKGMTQAELANAVPVTYQFISQIEKGIRKPNSEVLKAISDALCVSVGDLFNEVRT
jgi:transcriptional regulator with XRE-family HTH domain